MISVDDDFADTKRNEAIRSMLGAPQAAHKASLTTDLDFHSADALGPLESSWN